MQRILYVNSYHSGYPSSDEITNGIEAALEGKNIALEIVYMDTKRIRETSIIEKKAESIYRGIGEKQPDLIIVSDDNAVAHLVVPYLRNSTIPVIFCGVNWTAEPYDLPSDHVTGMLEILPVEQGIQVLRDQGFNLSAMTILSENTASEKKNIDFISDILEKSGIRVDYKLAADIGEWKVFFKQAGRNSDAIYLPTNGAIQGWDHEEVVRFIRESIQVPLITCDEFMMPYVVFGVTKIQQEQGEWAGKTALDILAGTEVENIPVTNNKRTRIWWNPELAELIGFQPGESFRNEAIRFEY